jgi:iron complex outermembrane recepter protein
MIVRRIHAGVGVATLILSGTGGGSVLAQTADSGNGAPPEVMVTAQKRTEDVATVPIVISVLSNQELVQSGINNTQDLEWGVPGLVFGNTNGFAEPYLRGIGTDLITPGQESPIGFYLDGVYLPLPTDLLQQFDDISRIEVLKGPQGTLYGRNTTGGAVNIITRDPQQDFSADATLSAGDRGYAKAVTYVTGALTDALSANFSGIYTAHNGFVDVVNTGDHLDNLDQYGLRGKLLYTLNSAWNVLWGADYLEKHDTSDTVYTALVGSNLPLPPGVGPSFQPYNTYTNLDPTPHRYSTDFGSNMTVRGQLGWANFTSITGFRDDSFTSLSDGDATTLQLLAYASIEGEQQFTQEFQLASNGSSPLQWLGGLYYLRATVFDGPVAVWSGIPVSDTPNAADLTGRGHITSYAGYGQVSYELPFDLKLIGGLRTTDEQRTLIQQTDFTTDLLNPAVRLAEGFPAVDTSKTWTSTDPKATLQWQNPGQLLYASYSTGFKAGSYNLISPGVPGPLDPEKIKAFEVGGKHEVPLVNQAKVDWAVFYYRYTNIQLAVQDPATQGQDASQNAASSINKGVDLDLAVPVMRNLTAKFGMEYLEARYESYPDAAVYNIVDGELDTAAYTKSVDASGNRMERAPLLTTSTQLQWLVPLPIGDIATTVLYYHNSGFYLDAGDEFQQKAYNLANLRIEYAAPHKLWSVAAWIDNAFNATVIGGLGVSPYVAGGFYNDPRIYGLSASVHF